MDPLPSKLLEILVQVIHSWQLYLQLGLKFLHDTVGILLYIKHHMGGTVPEAGIKGRDK